MIVSGLTTTISGILLKSIGQRAFEGILGNNDNSILDKRFAKAINIVSVRMQNKYPDALGGSLENFFEKPEVLEELFKLLYRSNKVVIEKFERYFDLTTLNEGFIDEYIFELKNELLKYHEFERIFSDDEIFKMVFEINNKIDSLISTNETAKEPFNFNNFYQEYKTVTLRNLSKINYFGLGLSPSVRRGEKTINDIYVKPKFSKKVIPSRKGSNQKSITNINHFENYYRHKFREIHDLFGENENKNIVILGKPGSGKSLLGKYVMCSILNQDNSEIPESLLDYIPFRIELRKYLPYKRKYSKNFIDYILHVLHKEYYFSAIEVNDLIEIIKNRKSLVIFDGLDEIFNIHNKIEVKNDIENFLRRNKKCKGVVTSRHIGYEEAKLDEEFFTESNILDFSTVQIEEYVNRWYDCEVTIDDDIQDEINMFILHTREIDNELIKNPLLLSLIVILYRNNGRLPNSKLEIYRSCTKTLVDKWDETKELEIDVKVISKKQSIFSLLAFWQYEKLSKASGEIISYESVYKEVSSIIFKQLKLTDDYSEAEAWAEEFLEYAKNRSLYHEDDFTHKTFMEYFTAFCIYQKTDKKYKPKDRNKIISKYISKPFWFIVLELLMNLIDEDQADNEIIDGIIEEHISNDKSAYVFFLHILNTLKNVSDSVKFELIKESMTYAIKKISVEKFEIQDDFIGISIKIIKELSHLLTSSEELLKVIQDIYDELFDEFEFDSNLLYKYYIFGAELKRSRVNGYRSEFKINKSERLEEFRSFNIYFNRITSNQENIVNDLMTFGDNFGLDNLYLDTKNPFYRNRILPSMVGQFIIYQLQNNNDENIRENYIKIINYGVLKSKLIESLDIFIDLIDKDEINISAKEILNNING